MDLVPEAPPGSLPQHMGRVYTPRKEAMPPLSFGNSSSPAFESPPTVGKEMRFMHWSPTQNMMKAGNAPQLLPSHFPPAGPFGVIPSSPPEPGMRLGNVDNNGSPRPRTRQRARGKQSKQNKPLKPRRKSSSKSAKGSPLKNHTSIRSTAMPASASFPLLSSKAFARACSWRSRSAYAPLPSPKVREQRIEPELEPVQEQFPSHGLGLSFIIDLNGKANVNSLRLTPSTPKSGGSGSTFDAPVNAPMTPHTRRTVNAILEQDSDAESDGEIDDQDDRRTATTPDMVTRTPPRFSSLGSSDAATAFARTLARSRDVGKGSMFLFPPTGSPRKHPELTPYAPFMPETPRRAAGSEQSTIFDYGLQTPPSSSFYGFDAASGVYATGMTPYLAQARSHQIANAST